MKDIQADESDQKIVETEDVSKIDVKEIIETSQEPMYTEYEGIGGWLILVLIGIVLSFIGKIKDICTNIIPFLNENFNVLLTPGTNYNPILILLVLFELIGSIVFVTFDIIALVLLFRRKKRFPKLMKAWYVINFGFVTIDYIILSFLPGISERQTSEALRQVISTIGVCMLWIPYFNLSKRVKATFTR